jgi:formate hydrogenlyase subunit 4
MGTRLPFATAADAIALVGLFATARVFLALAAMDIGTPFGTLGARREMMVGFLAEPALLMVIFVASLISMTTALPLISERLATQRFELNPEPRVHRGRLHDGAARRERAHPDRQSATHLELTMIHEAMLLEYSARHLALMEWAAALKLFNYTCIGFALFIPWGIGHGRGGPASCSARSRCWRSSSRRGRALALIETVSAKLRVFRAPEFLATAFCSRCSGLLVHILLGG